MTFDSNLAISYFEFLFGTFTTLHSVEVSQLMADLVVICLAVLPNENMRRLTTNKIIELSLDNLSTQCPQKTAFSMTLLNSVETSSSIIDKIIPFATGYNFAERPKPDQVSIFD